jgi:hypothetical protein
LVTLRAAPHTLFGGLATICCRKLRSARSASLDALKLPLAYRYRVRGVGGRVDGSVLAGVPTRTLPSTRPPTQVLHTCPPPRTQVGLLQQQRGSRARSLLGGCRRGRWGRGSSPGCAHTRRRQLEARVSTSRRGVWARGSRGSARALGGCGGGPAAARAPVLRDCTPSTRSCTRSTIRCYRH